ncbi:PAS domain-containing protein [Xanthobacter dioxanivorans]|uniref:histidine kinase n=1 Tax=Xanthobacter dioxanivorans TaxID=2528964 RepID=A0A974PR48_9HYPH|nr:ATP-binding protein [Xanthobacter dioxanivorans]QRG07996.1 PAS domain-containing protein [Xanthobacter dioxanivorans]
MPLPEGKDFLTDTPLAFAGAGTEFGAVDAEEAWIAVIRKMDETYAELVRQQVELEEKNAALEEAQGFIAGLLGSMTDVLVACDLSGRVEQVNLAAERAFGQRADALLGRPLAELLDAASPTGAADVLSTVARRQRIADREFALATPDGPLAVSVNGALRFDPRGRAVGIVLVGRPIGELRAAYHELAQAHEHLKRTQQQLVHAEKMASLGRLVAGVAHELNNPISFVYGNAHALKRYAERLIAYLDAVHAGADPASLAKVRGELRVDRALADIPATLAGMLEGAERVRDIVADLRRFSSDRREAREVFDMASVVRSAVDWVAKSQMPDLSIHVSVPEGLEVVGHPGHIHQVMMNLVQNAVDAMEGRPDRRLEITGARVAAPGGGQKGGQVVVRVRDTGPGIPEEIIGRVFDPFFTTKPVGKGTGLGLSICYRIAEEHEGRLEAANHPDGGAVVALVLPESRP